MGLAAMTWRDLPQSERDEWTDTARRYANGDRIE